MCRLSLSCQTHSLSSYFNRTCGDSAFVAQSTVVDQHRQLLSNNSETPSPFPLTLARKKCV